MGNDEDKKSDIRWMNETVHVDKDTGEIVDKRKVKNKEYEIIKTEKSVEINRENKTGRIKYTRICRQNQYDIGI